MVVKIYISLVSGNKEIKGKQERLQLLLESKKIEFESIDITDSANADEKQFMREHSVPKDGQKIPLPPQIFNDKEYCGDYDDFYEANENDEMMEFLMLAPRKEKGDEIQKQEEETDFQKEEITGEKEETLSNNDPPPRPEKTEVSRVTLGSIATPEAPQQIDENDPPPLLPRSSSYEKKLDDIEPAPGRKNSVYENEDAFPGSTGDEQPEQETQEQEQQ